MGEHEGIPRIDVLGVEISAVTMETAVKEILGWIERGERHYVCVTGVHGVMESQKDPALRQIHNESGLTTPDGMPMVWAGRWVGLPVERVYGPDLMLALSAEAERRGLRFYLYGGGPGVADLLADRLTSRFPRLQMVGTCTPPFRAPTREEANRMVADINAAAPDIVWVGLSTPKQEHWMAEHASRLTASALIGVGAAFDIHAGTLRQAPLWMQHNGLEWAYRLFREPRRLWRRYLHNNPRFVARILRQPPSIVSNHSRPRRTRRAAARTRGTA